MNPHGFTRPLSSLALSEQLFRPLNFHLPDFGRGFQGFPWSHVLFTLANTAVFSAAAVFIIKKERSRPAAGVFVLLSVTTVWIFVSAAAMKTFSPATAPIPRRVETNFRRNTPKAAEPILQDRLLFFSLEGAGDIRDLSFSVVREDLPVSLELSRGLYELRFEGRAPACAEAKAEIVYVRRNTRLAVFPVKADEEGALAMKKYIYLPEKAEATGVLLEASGGSGEVFEAGEAVITPVPGWLGCLSDYIGRTGKTTGLFRYIHEIPADSYARTPAGDFELVASHSRDMLPNMVDGDIATRWATASAQKPGMYFKADMGKIRTVCGVVLELGKFWPDWPRGLEVAVSGDGEDWERVYSDGGISGYIYRDSLDPCFLNMENCVRAVFEPVQARWIRVEQTGNSRLFDWSVVGFYVLGDGIGCLRP